MQSPWGPPPPLSFRVPTCSVAPWRTMLSRSRTPSPTVTPSPMETLGPSCERNRYHKP